MSYICTHEFGTSRKHEILNCHFYKAHLCFFSKVKFLSIVMPRNFCLKLSFRKGLLILMDFALKGDKDKRYFDAFALKLM